MIVEWGKFGYKGMLAQVEAPWPFLSPGFAHEEDYQAETKRSGQ